MREYLDPVVKADQCAQYVDDIGIAANSAPELVRNIKARIFMYPQSWTKIISGKVPFWRALR